MFDFNCIFRPFCKAEICPVDFCAHHLLNKVIILKTLNLMASVSSKLVLHPNLSLKVNLHYNQ